MEISQTKSHLLARAKVSLVGLEVLCQVKALKMFLRLARGNLFVIRATEPFWSKNAQTFQIYHMEKSKIKENRSFEIINRR